LKFRIIQSDPGWKEGLSAPSAVISRSIQHPASGKLSKLYRHHIVGHREAEYIRSEVNQQGGEFLVLAEDVA